MKWNEATTTSQAFLPQARLWAGWQASCFVTMAAVLAAFLYFGGNMISYGGPPRLLLPHSLSATEDSKRPPRALAVRVASHSGNVCEPDANDFVWFVPARINPVDEGEMRRVLQDYAREVNPAFDRPGLDLSTGLSHNVLKLQIDARCPAENYLRLLQIARECGIWKLYFSAQREPVW